MAAKMAGVPCTINTIHGFYFTGESPRWRRKFFITLEKIAALCSTLILSQNKEDMATAIRHRIGSREKIHYLGNGLDLTRFDPARFSHEFIRAKKKTLGIPPAVPVIGIVGRLVEEKGYPELFEALRHILKIFPTALLLVVGPEEPGKKDRINRKSVQQYGIADNILFVGQRTDMPELYAVMDVFVLPSHREGFPRTILEASAMGKPIIATSIRGCREAVEHMKTGILVPPRDAEKLAKILQVFLSRPEYAAKMGKGAREKAQREFDEQHIFRRIKERYERVIADRHT